MSDTPSQSVRARVREEMTAEITATARRHIAEHGAVDLSLRAVAREMGMASSALYRYFPSREALLTQLIIEAYDELGDAVEGAAASVDPADLLGRWRAIAGAARAWALANPHLYALIYGTPLPEYAAPDDTIEPASRVLRLLLGIVVDLDACDAPAAASVEISESLHRQITALLDDPQATIDRQRFLAMAGTWTALFGTISFEVFGRYHGMFDDPDALFAHHVDRAAVALGIET